MSLPGLKISKLWLDDSFFDVKFIFYTEQCSVSIDIYTDNEELNEFRNGIIEFSNFKQKEFVWIAGRDTEKVTHFLSLRFFLYDKRGKLKSFTNEEIDEIESFGNNS